MNIEETLDSPPDANYPAGSQAQKSTRFQFLNASCFNGGYLTPVRTTGGTPASDWLRNALAPFNF